MNENTFKQVFNEFNREIYLFVFSFLKDHERSEDLVQEVFLSLWSYRFKVKKQESIKTLLFTITRRKLIDNWRKQVSSDEFNKYYRTYYASLACHSTTQQIQFKEVRGFTEEAYNRLTEHQMAIFNLSRHEGLTYEEIAQKLNISKNTVKYHLKNALKSMKEYLAYHDIIYQWILIGLFFLKK